MSPKAEAQSPARPSFKITVKQSPASQNGSLTHASRSDIDPDLQRGALLSKRFLASPDRGAGRRRSARPEHDHEQREAHVRHSGALRASVDNLGDAFDYVKSHKRHVAEGSGRPDDSINDDESTLTLLASKRPRVEDDASNQPTSPARVFRPSVPFTTSPKLSTSPRAFFRPPSSSQFTSSLIFTQANSASDLPTSRPAFRRPHSSSQPENLDSPLPELFSPHRRGQKFVPGGLAATAQQWVLQVGQETIMRRRHDLHSADETTEYHIRAVQNERHSPGVSFVSGRILSQDSNSQEYHLALIRNGTMATADASRLSAHNVKPESTIQVKPPTWYVEASAVKWLVCVDWSVVHVKSNT